MTATRKNGKLPALQSRPSQVEAIFNSALRSLQRDIPYWRGGSQSFNGGDRWTAMDDELGYPSDLNRRLYRSLYERVGIASRVVNIWPDECWAAYPQLYQTEKDVRTKFERAWDDLEKSVLPWHYLHRADRLSRVGHFGVILLGLDDGADLDQPVSGLDPDTGAIQEITKTRKVNYLRVFDEWLVRVMKVENNVHSPRCGQPKEYEITLSAPSGGVTSETGGMSSHIPTRVHWTRVIHLADNREANEVYGVPSMRPVLNLIHDIRKTAGGSAEMFWRGAFPGYAFEANPDISGGTPIDQEEIGEEIDLYTRHLKRYLATVGGSWKSLAPQVADPSKHLTQYVGLLCATIGVPVRKFLGSESGHLASTTDDTSWKERVDGRRKLYVEPMILRPFVDRLMALGVLPRVKNYIIKWQDLRSMSDKDRADVALKQIQALMQYVTGNVNQILPLIMLYTQFLGLSEAQAHAIIEELKLNPPPPPVLPGGKGPGDQGGGKKGNPSTTTQGRKPGSVEGQSKQAKSKAPKPAANSDFFTRRAGGA